MSSIGHPVVGDALYGAPRELRSHSGVESVARKRSAATVDGSAVATRSVPAVLSLDRNFLHAAAIEFTHPRTGKPLAFKAPLPDELELFLISWAQKPHAPQRL